jgi:hypothetical protein
MDDQIIQLAQKLLKHVGEAESRSGPRRSPHDCLTDEPMISDKLEGDERTIGTPRNFFAARVVVHTLIASSSFRACSGL